MESARHSTAPHYLRFACALALVGCSTATTVVDGGSDAAPIVDAGPMPDRWSPPVQPLGDGACTYDGGGEIRACPPSCFDAAGLILGPLSPPDLAV